MTQNYVFHWSPSLVLILLVVFLNAAVLSDAEFTDHLVQFQSLLHSGNHEGAIRVAEEMTRRMPNDGHSWYVLAVALESQGKEPESLFKALQHAVNCQQHPPPPLAHLRLKQMYELRGQMDEAGYMLLAGAEAHPDNFHIWMEMCYLLLRMLSRSCLRVCQTAMRLSNSNAIQNSAYGALTTSGGPQEAIGIFAISDHQPDIGLFWLLRSTHAQLKLNSGSSAGRPRLRTTFWALVARARLLAWDISIPQSDGFFSELMSFPPKEIAESIVAFHFLEAGGPPEMILSLMSLFASRFSAPKPLFSYSEPTHFDGRVRVVFVSSHNFATNSTTARMVCPLIASMQQSRSLQYDFSVVGMSSIDEPHSSCLPITPWRMLSGLSDIATAQKLNEMRPHILVDTVGYTLKARVEVFGHRPARVQVHWHGMPHSSGSALFYDTYIGDRISTSVDFRSSWAESLLLLPLPYLMNSHKVVHPNIDRGAAATARTRRNLFSGKAGPSRASLLFASFNVPFKIQRELFDCWCRVVRRTGKLHLWIAGHFSKSVGRLRMMASQRNISHRVSALELLPRESEMQGKASADIALDTWEFGGHTTSVDSLWAGVPVLTFAGPSLMSRVSSSLLIHLGLQTLVARSREDYCSLMYNLARNSEQVTGETMSSAAAARQKLLATLDSHPVWNVDDQANAFRTSLKMLYETRLASQSSHLVTASIAPAS